MMMSFLADIISEYSLMVLSLSSIAPSISFLIFSIWPSGMTRGLTMLRGSNANFDRRGELPSRPKEKPDTVPLPSSEAHSSVPYPRLMDSGGKKLLMQLPSRSLSDSFPVFPYESDRFSISIAHFRRCSKFCASLSLICPLELFSISVFPSAGFKRPSSRIHRIG
jgi:hypothetical protein